MSPPPFESTTTAAAQMEVEIKPGNILLRAIAFRLPQGHAARIGAIRAALKTTPMHAQVFHRKFLAILIWQAAAVVNIEQPQRPAPCIGTVAANDEIAIRAKLHVHF